MNLLPVSVAVCFGLVFGHANSSAGVGSCQAKMTAFPLDPGSTCCIHATNDKIIPGVTTKIDQHPWAAIIDYDFKNGTTHTHNRLCSGTLISGKYVLTAGHCLVGPVLDIGTPTSVRLGEYDLKNEGPDCVAVEADGVDCTDGAISIEIETTIPHPKYYYPNHHSRWNDIGLIRLKQAVSYTDFIRPICLPTVNPEINIPDHSLYVVSWYQTTRTGLKAQYKVPFVNQEKCKPIYSKLKVVFGQGQLCAGGLGGMDFCTGDGGGPLVYENEKGLVTLTGIASFGPGWTCGKKDFPSVYTNVYEYLDWIKTVIVA